jgi:hypothetical protein
VPDRAGQEASRGAGYHGDPREDLAVLVAGLAVDGVVVLTAEPVVPDSGRVRHRRVDAGPGRFLLWLFLAGRMIFSHGNPLAVGERNSHFLDYLGEELRGSGRSEGLGTEVVHDLKVMLHILTFIQVEGAGELFEIHHVRHVVITEA